MIVIDGSYGEGGGQILRTSIALSSIFREPIRIINIRKNRKPPGLKMQHLHAIIMLSKITRAYINEIKVGSMEVEFRPNGIYGGKYKEDIGTAGSITLLLQAVLLPSLFADSKVRLLIRGGTDVEHSPSLDYFQYVLLPYYRILADISIKVVRRGFYPKGGGEVEVNVIPKFSVSQYKNIGDFIRDVGSIGSLDISFEEIDEVNIYSVASMDLKSRNVCERMIKGALAVFSKLTDVKIKKKIEYVNTLSTGAVITIVANKKYPFGVDLLGRRGLRAEIVGKIAAENFLEILKRRASVDKNLADNLVPILSLVKGSFITPEITGHLDTNIWVVKKFLNSLNVKIEKIDDCYRIDIR
ncbi:RNA 3'-terminal phosphate cyclase [Nanoarchaeota archaeon NZ13-N]|nr:MAG: RNA 3'-terminal phosphate cyclase [Nanoarchaeota archaeon NZ13-N]